MKTVQFIFVLVIALSPLFSCTPKVTSGGGTNNGGGGAGSTQVPGGVANPNGTPGATSGNCYADMTAKFGPDIVFPAQQLFPNLYAQARQAGPNGSQMLMSALQGSTCATLKAKG